MLNYNINNEIVEYDEELGKQCLEDPKYDWSGKVTDGVGEEGIRDGDES